VLKTENLGINFGGLQALKGVDFELREGEVKALIGPNGAGKTTFFNVICGNLKPSAGKVYFKGEDITGWAPFKICRLGLSRTFQKTSLFPELSVFENLRLAAQTGYGKRNVFFRHAHSDEKVIDIVERLIESVGLQDKARHPVANLSHGDQRLLEILVGLSTNPELLLLDEPTAGLSVKETKEMTERIKELARTSIRNVIIVEHDMEVVTELATRICVLYYGEILCEGTVDEIKSHPKVQEVYLGRSV